MTRNEVFYEEVCARFNQASGHDQLNVLKVFAETADCLPNRTLEFLDKNGFLELVFQSAAQIRTKTDALSNQLDATANSAFEKLLSVRPTIFAPIIYNLLNLAVTANTVTSNSENEPDNPPLDFRKTMGLLIKIAKVQPETFFPYHPTISSLSNPSRQGAEEWQQLQEITNPFKLMAHALGNEAAKANRRRTSTNAHQTP